jgi:adenylate kinase
MYNSKEQFEQAHNYVVVSVSVVGDVSVKSFSSRKSAENSDEYFNSGEVMTRRQYKKWLSDNEEKFAANEYH